MSHILHGLNASVQQAQHGSVHEAGLALRVTSLIHFSETTSGGEDDTGDGGRGMYMVDASMALCTCSGLQVEDTHWLLDNKYVSDCMIESHLDCDSLTREFQLSWACWPSFLLPNLYSLYGAMSCRSSHNSSTSAPLPLDSVH